MSPPIASFVRSLLGAAGLILLVALYGCAGNEEQEDTLLKDVTKAYETAQKAMLSQNYRRAIPIYEALQARFPFSDLSKQIQLELMYCYYKSNRPEQAVDLADQFMQENPIHPRVDYALYIKALTYFEDDPGFLERFGPAYEAELAAFVEVIHGERANPCDGREALQALRIAEACELSRAEHRPVRLAEIAGGREAVGV